MDGNEVEGYQLHTVEGTQSVTHDLRVGGKIYARVIKGRNAYLGVFKDGDALAAAYPTPTVGQWAETIEEADGQGGTTGYLYICEIVEEEEVWVRKTEITQGILYPATEERIQELEEKAVTYEAQSNKTSADKAQARANIGAAALNGDATEDFAAKDLTAAGNIEATTGDIVASAGSIYADQNITTDGTLVVSEKITGRGDLEVTGNVQCGNISCEDIDCGAIQTNGENIDLDGGDITNARDIKARILRLAKQQSGVEYATVIDWDNEGLWIEDSSNGNAVRIPRGRSGIVAFADDYYTKSVSDGRFAALNGSAQQDFAAKDLMAAGSIISGNNAVVLNPSGFIECGEILTNGGDINTDGGDINLNGGNLSNVEKIVIPEHGSDLEDNHKLTLSYDYDGLYIEDSDDDTHVLIPTMANGTVAMAENYYTKSVSDGRFAALNGNAQQDFAAKDLTAKSATTDELALTRNGTQSHVISGNASAYVKILNLSNGRHVNLPVVRDDVIALAGDFVEITNAEIDNMDWS